MHTRFPTLLSFAVLVLASTPTLSLLPAGEVPPARNLARVLQPFVDSHSLAGAVLLVANKEKVLSLESVGYCDITAKKSMSTDALFWIASQSKPITATALMMLVDEG